MESNSVVVKKSEIEGKGVFASRDFKSGEIVLQWDVCHTLLKDEVDKMSEKEKEFIAFFNGKYTMQQEPAKYVNHSCDPNTIPNNFCDVAIKDIIIGEEITSNYSSNSPPGKSMKCNCKSKNCKKIINY